MTVRPGDNVRAKLENHRGGTTFCFQEGTYPIQQPLEPKGRQRLIGVRGKTIFDGGKKTTAAIVAGGTNVAIKRLVIQNFANEAQTGAIDSRGGGFGWLIQGNNVHHNGGVGICVSQGGKIIGNRVHHNEQMGLCGAGDDILVQGNTLAYNNHEGKHDPHWEAGGMKFVYTRGLVVRKNYSHHNKGVGLWTDVNNIDTLYVGNRVVKNSFSGIYHEVSYDAVIRNNIVRGNGFGVSYWRDGAGIYINSSPNVKIHGNRVAGNNHGISITQTDRSAVPASHGPHKVKNILVHHNVVRMPEGYTGMNQMMNDNSYFHANIHFENNTYYTKELRQFLWMNDFRNKKGWVRFGHDNEGRFRRIKD